jgi:hypothetical protein
VTLARAVWFLMRRTGCCRVLEAIVQDFVLVEWRTSVSQMQLANERGWGDEQSGYPPLWSLRLLLHISDTEIDEADKSGRTAVYWVRFCCTAASVTGRRRRKRLLARHLLSQPVAVFCYFPAVRKLENT